MTTELKPALILGSGFHKHVFSHADGSSGGLATKKAEFIRTQASVPPQVVERDGKANPRIWFPNGTVLCPKSIRMGLHDYGRSLTSIKKAFRKLKRWERGLLGPTKASSPAEFESIKAELRQSSELEHNLSRLLGEPEIPLTWIAEFMYRPLWFAGVGLSSQESGLWWLLAQRARNTARLSNLPENHTRILVYKED